MRRIVAAGMLAALFACGPKPIPPPPPPSPPPPPPVEYKFPVLVGDRFDPPIIGYSVCCASDGAGGVNEGLRDGWALATPAAMKLAADHGLNAVIFRTGPYDPANDTMAKLRDAAVAANAVGLLPVVDLIDGWALVYKVNKFGDRCEVTQDRIQGRHRDHIQEVVQKLNGLKVIYTTGNEIERCSPSAAWIDSVAQTLKEFDPTAKIGSSIRAPSSGIIDFDTYHGFEVRGPRARPMLMDESNNKDYTPDEWWALIHENRRLGGNTIYWPGPHDDNERAATMALIKANQPVPPPEQNRNRVARLTIKIYRPDPPFSVGDQLVFDVTAKDEGGVVTWGEAGEVEEWNFAPKEGLKIGGTHPFQRKVTATKAGTYQVWAVEDGVMSNVVEWEVR